MHEGDVERPQPAGDRVKWGRLTRLDALVPVAWLASIAWLLAHPGHAPDPDAYYHVGCALHLLRDGWLSSFPWLRYTSLGPSFPDVHLLHHVLLVPVVAAFGEARALLVAPWLLSVGLGAALYAALRALRVPWRGTWLTFGMLGSTMLLGYATFIKGGGTFHIIIVGFLFALCRRSMPWTFLFAWISVYAYVGAPILIAMSLVFCFVTSVLERKLTTAPLLATVAGLAAGLLLNPFWPDHLTHIGNELGAAIAKPTEGVLEGERGTEWAQVDVRFMLVTSAPFLLAWLVLLWSAARSSLANRRVRLDTEAVSGLALCSALLLASLLVGPKIFHLFLLCSVLFIPVVATRLGPWSSRTRVVASAAMTAWCVFAVFRQSLVLGMQPLPSIDQYRALSRDVSRVAEPGAVVLAPWDDFGGLFLFNPNNVYVSGMNTEFLRQRDPHRFEAYTQLYRGNVADPQHIGPVFDDARVIVVRHRGGNDRLYQLLSSNRHFEAITLSVPERWAVFRRR